MFAYMKVLGVKDTKGIAGELARVKEYMSKVTDLKLKLERKLNHVQDEKTRAKELMVSALNRGHDSPAISSANFKGKHTKFNQKDEKKDSLETMTNRIIKNKKTKGKIVKPSK